MSRIHRAKRLEDVAERVIAGVHVQRERSSQARSSHSSAVEIAKSSDARTESLTATEADGS